MGKREKDASNSFRPSDRPLTEYEEEPKSAAQEPETSPGVFIVGQFEGQRSAAGSASVQTDGLVRNGQTNRRGVYAMGDVRSGSVKRVAASVGD